MSLSTEQINLRAQVSSKKTVSLSVLDGSEGELASTQVRPLGADGRWTRTPEDDGEREKTRNASQTGLLWKALLCVACGVVFGVSLHKSHMTYPDVVRRQMLLKQYTLIKFYLSALATSMFTLSILAMIPASHRAFMLTCNSYYNKLVEKSVTSSVVGGLLMGCGMAIAGSCPVTVFPQIGSLVPNIGYTFLGSLCGVFIYSVLKPAFDSAMQPTIKESSNPWSNSPYFVLALPLVAMFGCTVCAFEMLLPWDSEIKVPERDGLLTLEAWPPFVCGTLIGILQLPLVLSLHETLGGSSSFIVMVSQIFVGPLKKLSPFACRYQWGFKSWWQIFYVAGAILGGFLSAAASGTIGAAAGVSPLHGFVGGILLHLGARIAGGCTSGHGVSGMGMLSILSFIMMASTFTGGILTAFSMHFSGLL